MTGKELRETLAAGKRVYGIGLEGYGQPRWPRFMAQYDLDFVFMDNEHTPLNRETMAWAAQAYAAYGIAPLLRIPEPSPSLAAMAADLGAHGVIAPYVETVEQVKGLVGAVKYRPLKGEALQQILDGGSFPSQETGPYLDSHNPNALVIIMIESPAGLANLPDMLATGGVDVILIGPHDLSVSLGVPEQYDHPLFEQTAGEIIRVARSHNVGAGIHFTTGNMERARRWIDWGCNFIVHRTDTLFIAGGIQSELDKLRQELDDQPETPLTEIGAAGHAI